MVSSQILLAWIAVGATVLVSSVSAAPVLPPCDLKVVSKLKQKGATGGDASVSTTGSTQGSGSIKCVVVTPTSVEKKTAVGNAGVSGASVSAGDGVFTNLVKALTKVKTTKKSTKVKTKTVGGGITEGMAAISQLADANGGATLKEVEIDLLTDGEDLLEAKKAKKGTATSSSSHKGSGAGDSIFKVLNEAETKVELKGL